MMYFFAHIFSRYIKVVILLTATSAALANTNNIRVPEGIEMFDRAMFHAATNMPNVIAEGYEIQEELNARHAARRNAVKSNTTPQNSTTQNTTVSDEEIEKVAIGIMGLIAAMLLFPIIGIAILIASFVIWLIALIQLCNRDPFKDKTLWILIVLLTGTLGAIVYLIVGREKRDKQPKEALPQNPQPEPILTHTKTASCECCGNTIEGEQGTSIQCKYCGRFVNIPT